MKRIPVGKMFALVDDADFEMLARHKWWASKGRHTTYAMTVIQRDGKRKMVRMHKMIMAGSLWVDHVDQHGLNNQRSNLRFCTPQQNEGNSRMKRANKSGVKGVSWDASRSKWAACISVNYKTIHLGRFINKEDAAAAYRVAAEKHFGEFANG